MNVTALLAHPDDELICAGTLARFAAEGHDVRVLTVFMDEREWEWKACLKVLGVEPVIPHWMNSYLEIDEDTFVWSRATVMQLEDALPSTYDLLISHRAEDPNTSHAHIGRIARTLCRKNRTALWELDQTMPGGIDPDAPAPNHFVAIDPAAKVEAMLCYPSQLERYPGWLAAAADRDRMYGWQIGAPAAEAFRIVKSVWL